MKKKHLSDKRAAQAAAMHRVSNKRVRKGTQKKKKKKRKKDRASMKYTIPEPLTRRNETGKNPDRSRERPDSPCDMYKM
jgi:hypothetical protein